MRRISGGGISMPCYLNITVDEFALRHRNYCLGLICFGPSEYSSRSEMLVTNILYRKLSVTVQSEYAKRLP